MLGIEHEKDVYERRPREIKSPKQRKKWTSVKVGTAICVPTPCAKEAVELIKTAVAEVRSLRQC